MSFGRQKRLTRVERAALARRARARAHLERRAGGVRARRRSRPAGVLLLAASMLAGAFVGAPLLRAAQGLSGATTSVESIHVRGAAHLAPEAVAEATGVARGAALASVDPDEVAARVAELPWIARARAVRVPAGPLVVGIEERVPVAVVRTGGSAAFVDATGTPFAPATGTLAELPLLVMAEDLELGEPDARLATALELAQRLPEHGLAAPVEVHIAKREDPEGFSLRLAGVAGRVVLGRDAPEARLEDLTRLLASGLPEVADATRLDLRFRDRAVLREEPPRSGAAEAAAARGSAAASRPGPSG